jgi:hypothetical protein
VRSCGMPRRCRCCDLVFECLHIDVATEWFPRASEPTTLSCGEKKFGTEVPFYTRLNAFMGTRRDDRLLHLFPCIGGICVKIVRKTCTSPGNPGPTSAMQSHRDSICLCTYSPPHSKGWSPLLTQPTVIKFRLCIISIISSCVTPPRDAPVRLHC